MLSVQCARRISQVPPLTFLRALPPCFADPRARRSPPPPVRAAILNFLPLLLPSNVAKSTRATRSTRPWSNLPSLGYTLSVSDSFSVSKAQRLSFGRQRAGKLARLPSLLSSFSPRTLKILPGAQ